MLPQVVSREHLSNLVTTACGSASYSVADGSVAIGAVPWELSAGMPARRGRKASGEHAPGGFRGAGRGFAVPTESPRRAPAPQVFSAVTRPHIAQTDPGMTAPVTAGMWLARCPVE